MKSIGGLRVRKVEEAQQAKHQPHENAREYAAHYIGTVVCAALGHEIPVGGAFPCSTCLTGAEKETELACKRLVFPQKKEGVKSGADKKSQSHSGRKSGGRVGRNAGSARAGRKRRTGE